MMMVILIVDGELMDFIEMMVDKQADLVVHICIFIFVFSLHVYIVPTHKI